MSDMSGGDTRPRCALAGLRVLDIGTVYAAPFAATLLGDLDADVIKVELPNIGDPLRGAEPSSYDYDPTDPCPGIGATNLQFKDLPGVRTFGPAGPNGAGPCLPAAGCGCR